MTPLARFHVASTKSSPEIDFDPVTHTLSIKGESYPENCARFYNPMFQWLREYLDVCKDTPVRLVMEIVYFNSSSSKAFMDLFDMLDAAAEGGRAVTVLWGYHAENETAFECGEEFQEDVQHVAFELVRIAA